MSNEFGLQKVMADAVSAAESGQHIFSRWYEVAGVRTDERILQLDRDEVRHKLFFPSDVIPYLQHDLTRGLTPEKRRYVSAQHLFQWLLFTADFEQKVVIRTTSRIYADRAGFDTTKAQRRDALKILVDEEFHTLYSVEVCDQLQEISGIEAIQPEFDTYLCKLDGVSDDIGLDPLIVQMLQVVVFETLITSLLQVVPDDPQVIDVVRATVRNHVADEVRHHAYFSLLFKSLWRQLDEDQRILTGTALPQILIRSLRPLTNTFEQSLGDVGLRPAEVATVMADTYAQELQIESVRKSSRRTLALFASTGLFEVPEVRAAFRDAGLL